MRFRRRLILGTFKKRLNRFLGLVEIEGDHKYCYIPNPGRLNELLYSGSTVYLNEERGDKRKTEYDLVLVDLKGLLVSIDSRVPNKVIAESIKAGKLSEFNGFNVVKKEPMFERSRLDFLLMDESCQLLLEVKSCTLVKNRIGFFPDAPTNRGSRHIQALITGLKKGRSALLILIQRSDAYYFKPNEDTDPTFAENLRSAVQKGVEVYVYNSSVTLKEITINNKVKVLI